jgi:general nucleoside transport system ATP-binding protein
MNMNRYTSSEGEFRRGPALAAERITKSFGSARVLEDVSISIAAGSLHALLGENGAGKSTLVKCLMGVCRADNGRVLVNGREVHVRSPRDAHDLGIGMVYQHFTLVPSLTGTENLVMSRARVSTVIHWAQERSALDRFLKNVPIHVPMDVPVSSLAAGERQKLEILKQLYLRRNFLILDEPTSVLTPGEADSVLGQIREMTRQGDLTALMITHKFREVEAFADSVSVLRRGRLVGTEPADSLSTSEMAKMMVGDAAIRKQSERNPVRDGETRLEFVGVFAQNDLGKLALSEFNLKVRGGEIVGVAGVSGNGQRELVEVVSGQREMTSGRIFVRDQAFEPTREQSARLKIFSLPEEPLHNSLVPNMSVAENIAFRMFDRPPIAAMRWLFSSRKMKKYARDLVEKYRVVTPSINSEISTLSGGNMQRVVLAREVSGDVDVLIVANPCFGLDFATVAEIHCQIMEQRNNGAAVLLVTEDLDEIMTLADRVVVITGGRLRYSASVAETDRSTIGRYMGGG